MPGPTTKDMQAHDCRYLYHLRGKYPGPNGLHLTYDGQLVTLGGTAPGDRIQGVIWASRESPEPVGNWFTLPDRSGSPTIYWLTPTTVCFTTPERGFGALIVDDGSFVDEVTTTGCGPPPNPWPPAVTWLECDAIAPQFSAGPAGVFAIPCR